MKRAWRSWRAAGEATLSLAERQAEKSEAGETVTESAVGPTVKSAAWPAGMPVAMKSATVRSVAA